MTTFVRLLRSWSRYVRFACWLVTLVVLTACGAKTGLRVPDAGTYNATVSSVCQCGMCGNQPFCINKFNGEFVRWSSGCDPAVESSSTSLSIYDRNGALRTVHCVGHTVGGGADPVRSCVPSRAMASLGSRIATTGSNNGVLDNESACYFGLPELTSPAPTGRGYTAS